MASFCLIHGAWHDGSCWEEMVGALEARGHAAATPDLPFHDPRAGYEERVRPAIEAIQGMADPVVVVGHSMAASYAPLVAVARPGSLLVLLCPNLAPLRPGFPFPVSRPDGTCVWDPHTAVEVMYPRLPPATARDLAERLHPMAPAAGENPLPGHPDVPTAVVYASHDEFFDPVSQRSVALDRLGVEPIEVRTGHFPMVEDREALADVLDRVADDFGRG